MTVVLQRIIAVGTYYNWRRSGFNDSNFVTAKTLFYRYMGLTGKIVLKNDAQLDVKKGNKGYENFPFLSKGDEIF